MYFVIYVIQSCTAVLYGAGIAVLYIGAPRLNAARLSTDPASPRITPKTTKAPEMDAFSSTAPKGEEALTRTERDSPPSAKPA